MTDLPVKIAIAPNNHAVWEYPGGTVTVLHGKFQWVNLTCAKSEADARRVAAARGYADADIYAFSSTGAEKCFLHTRFLPVTGCGRVDFKLWWRALRDWWGGT